MADTAPVISLHNIEKAYLERPILEGVSFTVHEGECVALLGANGAGKSTLMGIISGKTNPDSGEVRMRRDLTVAYLDQGGSLRDEDTVMQGVESAFAHIRELESELDSIHTQLESTKDSKNLENLLHRQATLQEALERADYHKIEALKEEAMRELGLPPSDRIIGELSGGERRRVALCKTLLESADLLLLDEPTNHLDAETLDWLEDFLNNFKGTVILITHDRYFLDNVATKMIEVARGEANVYAGNYSDYMLAKQEEEDRAQRAEATRQNLLKRELEWLRRQPKARTTKSKSRIDRAHDLMNSKPLAPDGNVQMLIPTGPRLGKTLIEAEDINYTIQGRTLIKDFNFKLGKGERIGVVGRNGLGKTTLLKILMKQLEPESGTVHHGTTVKLVYADQNRMNLDLEKTVLEEVSGDLEYVQIGDQRIGFRSWLNRFLFDDNTAAMPVKLLSGGEKNRVQMAKMIREGGNVVVLDEPTNDLDLPTLRILEEALANFDGSAFIVSHDRYFLNRVANRIISFRGDGHIDTIEGNYDHFRIFKEKLQEREDADKSGENEKAQNFQPLVPTPKPKSKPKKLSYNEQREFDSLEEKIMEAEARVEELESVTNDPSTFTETSHDEVQKILGDLQAAKDEVERLYARWAELSERAS